MEKSAALLDEELPHGGLFRESDRPMVSVPGFGAFPKKMQEMSANRPVGFKLASTSARNVD
jgi:hypothetical protein